MNKCDKHEVNIEHTALVEQKLIEEIREAGQKLLPVRLSETLCININSSDAELEGASKHCIAECTYIKNNPE